MFSLFSSLKIVQGRFVPHCNDILVRFATKKTGGSTKNNRGSPGQRLGVKLFGGQAVFPGNIIIRQRGMKVRSGDGTKVGRDHTIYAVSEGWVKFTLDKIRKRQVVSVSPVNPNMLPKRVLDLLREQQEQKEEQ